MSEGKYRLVTRSDFDGLVCAVLLREMDLIDEITFVHPKDMQDGKIPITGRDITTNLPYVPEAHICFDHHYSETLRVGEQDNLVIDPNAPSAARVVFEHYGGKSRFSTISDDMMLAVDQADSAQYSEEDILAPDGWTLLNFIMDARTGLGRFREFSVSNYQLMMELIEYCRTHSIEEILSIQDVQERVRVYYEHEEKAEHQLNRSTKKYGNVSVVDLRDEDPIYACNRFMIYALNPDCTVSIHVLWGKDKQNTVFACGKSIIDRGSTANIGAVMLEYGGGGHEAAGTCQVAHDKAKSVLSELIAAFKERD